MNHEDEEIRQKILDEIEKTIQLIEDYKQTTKPVTPDVSIGRISRMDAINNQAVTEAALRKAKNRLGKLEHVLSKVGTRNFGLCAKCGSVIPLGRILIVPESRFCVKCAV